MSKKTLLASIICGLLAILVPAHVPGRRELIFGRIMADHSGAYATPPAVANNYNTGTSNVHHRRQRH